MNKIKSFLFRRAIPFTGKLLNYRNKFINVIYYHDIVSGEGYKSQKTNIDLFKKHMQYIIDNGYKTFTFDELDNADNLCYQKKSVLITFDDGWRSNYTEIFDFMKKNGIKYNIFLECGNVGTNEEYLTWDMIREMHASGLVGFGAHTYSHPDASDISKIDSEKEFNFVNERIKSETGICVKDFCYPFGKWSESSNEYLIDNTEYTRIYTSAMLFSYEQKGKIVFGRSSINGELPFCVFKNMLNGNYNAYRFLKGK